jgi:hypothetical protein
MIEIGAELNFVTSMDSEQHHIITFLSVKNRNFRGIAMEISSLHRHDASASPNIQYQIHSHLNSGEATLAPLDDLDAIILLIRCKYPLSSIRKIVDSLGISRSTLDLQILELIVLQNNPFHELITSESMNPE